ncbi:MAG: hypothetical protein ABI855_02900 [Bacteroidota bacterium]
MKKTNIMNCVKIFAVAAIATAVITSSTFAQGGDAPFVKGSKTLGLGLGIGVNYGYGNIYNDGTSVPLPTFMLTYDQGFFEDVGPGTIGIGGVIGFKTTHYDYDHYYYGYGTAKYRHTYTNYIVAVRGTYHLTILKDKNNKFDPYAGITLGVRIFHHAYNDPYSTYDYNYNPVYPVTGAFIGAKYNVAEHFGFWAELGYDYTNARIGINFNF